MRISQSQSDLQFGQFSGKNVTAGPLKDKDTGLTVNTSCSLTRFSLIVRNGKQWHTDSP